MHRHARRVLAAILALTAVLATTAAVAAQTPTQPVPGAVDAGSLIGPTLRMVASLAAVLAVVGALAWLAQKLRGSGRLQTGLIQVVSGVSLGAREKVVLLRVGQEQVLVGVSPAGMRALHVLREAPSPPFDSYLEDKP
ncbi:MAG: flagellar biosynthetic protein FliO [Gammaproteobacteria bacterium]|nr:flagellar biosynthetic protein FliO [Gammaproteobacteria bacterium]